MPASKVYFTDFRCRNGVSQLDKLRKLLEKSEFSQIDFDGKFVAIKLHFGELGNLSFLRANYAKVVADFIKERGGRPFITDCNTLYVGSRKNALEHMDTAYLNGYSPFSTGCHVIIADGLKGSDDIEVPVAGGEYCKTAKIGRAIMDADVFISLTHFKGHESNYRRDADRVVYSSEGILTRREVSLVNRLIRNEKEDLVRNYRLLERTDPGFTLERLMLKHRKEQYDQSVDKFILQYIDTLLEEGKQSTAASYTSGLYSLLRFCSLRKINFKDIDYVFVTDYIHYLRMRGISENSIHMYLSNFRAVYNKARKQGIY